MLNQEDFVKDFENQEFVFCGVNWWPLIKIQVVYQLHLKKNNIFKMKDVDQYYNLIKTQITLKDKIRFYSQILKRSKSVKNLVITDFSNKRNTDLGENTGDNPYTDPFIHYFEILDIDFMVFDYRKQPLLFGYDLSILRKIYLQKVKNSYNKNNKFQSQLVQLCDFLSTRYEGGFNLYNHLVENIIINQTEFLIYKHVLKKSKVKNILLYCYYNNFMLSVIRAANHLNIETIEYQHSQVTSNHFAYSSWDYIRNNSSDFFPSKIWTWRQSDAEYLARQFHTLKKNNFIVGGNLSLSLSKNSKAIKKDSSLRVLITLQGIGLPEYITNSLSENPNVTFYLRLHPRYPQDKEICELLKYKYKGQVEIDVANSLTLHELLCFIDYHLTNYSGSAIEADYFDVPNIIYGDKGYLSYENEIKTGKYLFINSQDDLELILGQRLMPKSYSREENKDICELIKENFS